MDAKNEERELEPVDPANFGTVSTKEEAEATNAAKRKDAIYDYRRRGGRLFSPPAVETVVGKLGNISLSVGGNGFKGSLGSLKVVSADLGEDAGVLNGSLTLKYVDAAGKVKNRKVAVGGVVSDGTAAGTATPKGGKAKVFAAELE